jgi:hypothetical protein
MSLPREQSHGFQNDVCDRARVEGSGHPDPGFAQLHITTELEELHQGLGAFMGCAQGFLLGSGVG